MVLNGVSKVYAMTGWRIGYAGGPAELVKAMKKVQSQSTSNPTSISQVAAQAALEGDQACIQPMVKAFRERHDFVVDALNNIPGITCLPADGTFYCFPLGPRQRIRRPRLYPAVICHRPGHPEGCPCPTGRRTDRLISLFLHAYPATPDSRDIPAPLIFTAYSGQAPRSLSENSDRSEGKTG
jgi:hypothetical protein